MAERQETQAEAAVAALRKVGRPVSVAELAALGVSRVTLHRMVRSGRLERGARGHYCLPSSDDDPRIHWAAVAMAVPEAVFCMQSAAAYHGLTQNMAAHLDVAIPSRHSVPSASFTPAGARWTRWSSEDAFVTGVVTAAIAGIPVRITDRERTVVDLFRFSSLCPQRKVANVSVDDETVLEAVARYYDAPEADPAALAVMAMRFGVGERMAPILKMAAVRGGPGPG